MEEAAYDTVFLGSDGSVVRDSRAPKKSLGKNGKKSHAVSVEAPRVSAGYWDGDGMSGAPSIVIDLTNQKASFYIGGKLAGMSPVSTGREGYLTPPGKFQIIQKSANHVSNLYGNYVDDSGNVVMSNVGVNRDARPPGSHFQGASMPWFMRIHGAVGLHGGYLPGYPASHGCIRMPMDMAKTFFEHAPTGTPVAVVY